MTKKNPPATAQSRLKDQARKLLAVLSPLAPELTYAQTLEALARSQGNRTLHVYQAQKPVVVEGQPLHETARRMAVRMFFQSSGRWLGKEVELLHELDCVFQQADEKGSRFVEDRVHELTERSLPVEVKPAYDHLRHDEWATAFSNLVSELAEGLSAEANVELHDATQSTLFKGLVRDWRVADGELDLADKEAAPYELTLSGNRASGQFFVDVQRPNLEGESLEGTTQMGLFIEVNQGLPCVHLTNRLYGDQVLSVFFTKDGLYLRPEAGVDCRIQHGVPLPGSELAELHARESVVPSVVFNAHIETPEQ